MTTKGYLGAIACPPSLLDISRAKANDQLHLIHYESDRLCSWKPGPLQLQDSCTSYTYITNEIASYKGHFGPSEHDYSHWLALNLPHGFFFSIAALLCASCSSSDLKLPPRPNGMLPHSDLSHGSVTNLTLSWSSSLNKQWNTSLHGRFFFLHCRIAPLYMEGV